MTAPLEQARAAVAACGRQLVTTGLVVGSAGNVSARVGDRIVVTPSGVPYDRIGPSDVCVIDMAGRPLDGPARPSSETPTHLSVYASTDAAAIVHHHGVHSTAVASVLDEPDRGGHREDALSDADGDPFEATAAVVFEVEPALGGVVD
ncbi:class II aldolase/adducin family protein [Streptomyces sp. NPDC006668]|uniref:class II aldolase/adducin family protein n=1 Tax=Streptomyces sp. NPDC006668 TaxID=3156903 RepID=UPI0033D14386